MSTPNASADRLPSWRVAVGLFAAVVGYLVALFGVVLYTWDELQYLYGVPVLVISAVGVVVVIGGGALIWSERA